MNILGDIAAFMFPNRCHVCDQLISNTEKFVCKNCLNALPRTLYHRMAFNPMEQRFAGSIKYERATAAFLYSQKSEIATIIHDFKYRGYYDLATYMGRLIASELYTSGFFSDIDLLTPIPIHFTKRIRRGYNQTEYLAKGISQITNIPVSTNLIASRHHKSQTAKDLYQRWINTKDTFAVKHTSQFTGKHILIIDDVCTTGATIIAAAEALSQVPNIKISILTLATTRI